MKKLMRRLPDMLMERFVLGKNGHSLQHRSFIGFILFLTVVMSGIFFILLATGVFSVGLKECRLFIEHELQHISEDVMRDFGALSVEGVALSKRLAEKTERKLAEANLDPDQLIDNPWILETVLNESAELMLPALEKNKSSGVFLILDATVNPNLPGANYSRAGLYFKNMEPNVINLSAPAIRFLRGPATIARQRNISMLPQWQMEFRVQPDDFFFTTIRAASVSALSLSRLYYWNLCSALAGSHEQSMLLCVPLLASDGTVMGVCGFEVSAMLFKLQNNPGNTNYTRAFVMLAPVKDDAFDTSQAIYAGNYGVTPFRLNGKMAFKTWRSGLLSYKAPDGQLYTGFHQKVRLYPKNAAFSTNEWALAVLVPERDLQDNTAQHNRRIGSLLLIFFILSVGAAGLISRRSVAPVVDALEMVKSRKVSEFEKTNILEIDDLITFLASQDEPGELTLPTETSMAESALFKDFVKNIETLSPAERAVFNLYLEGYTATEIAKILCLSINTIKTHNKRIYMKLNVTSRKELMVYVRAMKEPEQLEAD